MPKKAATTHKKRAIATSPAHATASKADLRPNAAAVDRMADDEQGEGETGDGDTLEPEVLLGEADVLEGAIALTDAVDPVLVEALAIVEPTGLASLGASDPVALYMREIRRYPLLTEDEEKSLTRTYAATRDPQLAYRLISANLRLVVKIAMEYRRAYSQILDLIQEGNLGLLHAVQKYDPDHGIRLPSYSQWWIRAYILRFLLANYRLVKIGTTQAQRKLFYNLNKERDRLISQGFDPGTKMLAERLGVDEKTVSEMNQRMSARDMSIDAPMDDDGFSLSDTLPSHAASPEQQAVSDDLRQIVRRRMNEFRTTLEGRDLILWDQRLVAEEPITLQEIGESFGITRERARQLEARLKRKFKEFLSEEMGDLEDIDMVVDE
jgi:RNA polymerase sigma-32 factor